MPVLEPGVREVGEDRQPAEEVRDDRRDPLVFGHGGDRTRSLRAMRLNAFIARAGVASRRKADELIKAGRVTVNGSRAG